MNLWSSILENKSLKKGKVKELLKLSAGLETVLLTVILKHDTQDNSSHARENLESQSRRQKLRRHEERLREEHADAVKKAREQNLVFRWEFIFHYPLVMTT
ncbi:hypothetical protein DD237_001109 [Peronospora effusa]|uniref:Uncharacterized protein n=1 Tax=Peronospora effusa TaxID=542832 RepID=A0A425CJU1_9STRA|nr:hypothetical protein DD237_001109 [Peronospora effusa]